jgi:PEP-CTERM motif
MERVRKCIWMSAMLGGVAMFAERSVAQNLLVNPSFEQPITQDGPPFVGFWEGFNGSAGASAANSTSAPRTGAQNVDLSIVASNNNFAGVFQDVVGLIPGQLGTFSGWHKTPSNPFDVGAEFRIEWRNSVSNTEVSRINTVVASMPSQYTEFSVTQAVPAGADTARVVYAIQSFGPGPTDTGIANIDDFSFTIPEPTSMAALTLGGLVVSARRRRAS